MSRLTTRAESDLQAQTLDALNSVRINGQLAQVYLQFANSDAAIRAYLHMERSVREGSLTPREIEAVKLWVSQRTGCDYCLAVHTHKASLAGLSSEEQLAVRAGGLIGDRRVDTIVKVVARLFNHAGSLDESTLAEARQAGLSDENLVDLTMVVSTIFFTNITNHINQTESTFPAAPPLVS